MDELTVTRDRELFRLKRKDQTWWIEEPFQSKANQSEVLSLLKKLAVLDFSPHIRFEKASFEEPLLDVRYRYGAKEGHWVLGVLEPQKNAYPLKVEHSSQIQALPLSTYTSFNWDPWHYRDKTVFSHNSKDLSQIDVFYGETFQYRALKSEEVWRISNDKTVFHPVNHYFYLILNILENSMVQKFVTRDAKIFESKPTLRMQVTLQNGEEKIYLYYERSGYWLLHDEEKTVLMKDVAFEYWRRPFEKLVE
jgi:hypothetical protein